MTPADIRTFRQSLGLSAGAFARALGVSSDRLVRSWESGEVSPHPTVIVLLTICQREPACLAILLERAKKR